MVKADLHVHSRFSAHPSEWFLKRLGTRESYTSIDEVYETARERGMTYVTITDHNCIKGAMKLKQRYPDTVFTGVEATAYFPEDGCKVHILVYGLNEAQFELIECYRNNIYDLRDYLKKEGLAHSVAHATFSVDGKLRETHIHKLLLLFDYFELINGARSSRANKGFAQILQNLSREHIESLQKEYGITPFSDTPWIKGLTAGSDDHSGLQIAATCTGIAEASSPEEFLRQLIGKKTSVHGTHNDYKRFAFSIYKIAYEFSKEKSGTLSSSIFSSINRLLFDERIQGLRNRFVLGKIRKNGGRRNRDDKSYMFGEIIDEIERVKGLPVTEKVDVVYRKLSTLSDELLEIFLTSIEQGLSDGDLPQLVKSVAGVLPVVFMSLPFLSTVHILNESRPLQEKLDDYFKCGQPRENRKILWFTDTIADLNGPSETIRKLAWISSEQDLNLIPVVCLLPEEEQAMLPPNIINLSSVWTWTPTFFSLYTARIPSLLDSIKVISEAQPDEILISTPGPMGLLGLLIARLLHIPCKGIYHTDFSRQASLITGDDTVSRVLEDYCRWFYRQCDEIKVPTKEYIRILTERHYPEEKMTVFYRGIEHSIFSPQNDARRKIKECFNLPEQGITLLYAGRISADKHVELLLDTLEILKRQYENISLVFAGSGPEPYYREFMEKARKIGNAYFLGRQKRETLPLLYSGCNLLLFPSTTDTFGMVVLEAQACGLPALVTDVGGPKEIVIDRSTGFVLPADNPDAWADTVAEMITMINIYPEKFIEMRNRSREHVLKTFNWKRVLDNIFGVPQEVETFSKREETGSDIGKPSLEKGTCV